MPASNKNKRIAIYGGSFDPLTLGHMEIISRALRLFDEVVVAIGHNSAKPTLFTIAEREAMVREACKNLKGVSVRSFSGLSVEFVTSAGAMALLRGLRSEADFSYEMPMAMMNRRLAPSLETIFIPTSPEYCYLSSSLIREVARLGGEIKSLVPPIVFQRLTEKFPDTL